MAVPIASVHTIRRAGGGLRAKLREIWMFLDRIKPLDVILATAQTGLGSFNFVGGID
jgi:hypothetical protein